VVVPTGQLFAAGSMLRPAGVEAARWERDECLRSYGLQIDRKSKNKENLGGIKDETNLEL
jgi:hypothetical protein